MLPCYYAAAFCCTRSVPALVLQRFFDSLSVLMSNCTRHVVMESLRVLLRFFQRYGEHGEHGEHGGKFYIGR